ncbi:tryptophan 7-halogenase [Azospirillum sp. TSO22-1]|uniref:NAD(P)/FAD-dependent oxidoreductase n=1 Tax=Azospirillum sp. TSO22-1 TaxID=716789 RepID=UPI000D644715|nr:tryptophan 7-halogenase [Azospirillum sp. TSO22-1]
MSRWDVVVLGGGPAGCGTALALRRRGVERVLVVEAGTYGAVRIGESVPPDIRAVLGGDLGLWDAFLAEGHEPCFGSRSAWGSDVLGFNDFLFNPHGHGWHLDRRRFDAFLARQAAEGGIAVATGVRFAGSEELEGGGHRLHLSGADGSAAVVEAGIVVDATGPRGRFARLRGARARPLDRLVFVAGFFGLPEGGPLTRQTMLEAAEHGWWYAARLPDTRCVVALAADAEEVRASGLTRPDAFLDRLRRTRHLLPALDGSGLEDGSVATWVAVSYLRERVAGANWLAVGDAASGYDPLSSQGIQKALTDAVDAADAIAARLGGGTDLGTHYPHAVNGRFADYLYNRNRFYATEARWPDASFWCNRRARTELRPAAGRA